MPKNKVIEAVEEATGEEVVVLEEATPGVKQIVTDLGRTDLNELRDAVNECLRR